MDGNIYTTERYGFLCLPRTITNRLVEHKYIFEEAIKSGVPKIIVVHNHPSGDPTPSIYDYEITEKIKKVGDLLKIELLDHIIIGNGKYATAMRRKDNIYEIKDV